MSTRAFYRHFDSKDQLVAALFLEMARVEMLRLRQRMAAAPDPVRAVAAWIDGRLDLAFNDEVRSDLRKMSLEAQSQMFAAPELVGPAYDEILRPLVEQLERGRDLGLFTDIDPANEALSIQGVVWSNIERQWADVGCNLSDLRDRVQRFCLRGLGVAAGTIAEISDTQGCDRPRRKIVDLGLAGSAAVVTGGSKGMGLAIAQTLAAEGARVAVMARGQAALDAAVESLLAAGAPDAVGISVDMTDADSIAAGFATVGERWGR